VKTWWIRLMEVKNDEVKSFHFEGIYIIKMVGLGKLLKWFKEISKSVGL
jgi:hypothetical protein